MIPPALPRRIAAFLLQSAISIAPRDTLDWGHAMLAELHTGIGPLYSGLSVAPVFLPNTPCSP